jgi:hypothetical protein
MADTVLEVAGTKSGHWLPLRLRAGWRLWRIRKARRAVLRQVLAETADPRVLEEAGLAPPGPSGLELFARALLQHRR